MSGSSIAESALCDISFVQFECRVGDDDAFVSESIPAPSNSRQRALPVCRMLPVDIHFEARLVRNNVSMCCRALY